MDNGDNRLSRASALMVEANTLPAMAKTTNQFGQFSRDRNSFCLFVQAISLDHLGDREKVVRLEGPYYGGHHEIVKKFVKGVSVKADEFQSFCAHTMLGEDPAPIVVHVLLTLNGSAEVFSSYLTGASTKMQRMVAEDQDYRTYRGPLDENLHRAESCCAYCLASTRSDCLQCEHPTCKKKWKRQVKMCGGCRAVFYCSAQCQRKDWARGHIVACKVFRWLSPRFNHDDKPISEEVLVYYCSWMEAKALEERGVVLKLQDEKEDPTKDPESSLFGMAIVVD
jgi:hypothetical protein